jgi:DNA-3-methyladenine glycosylase
VTFEEIVGLGALEAAPALLGWTLLVDGVGGVIVELEAYREDDEASHTFGGPRGRNLPMFGPPGHLYVYRSYGLHWCANVVCAALGRGEAVLLRALEPTHGLDRMRERRGGRQPDRLLCAGPGRLAQALGLTGDHNGTRLDSAPFRWESPSSEPEVGRTRRIGISRAVERDWRYVVKESPWVSHGPRSA